MFLVGRKIGNGFGIHFKTQLWTEVLKWISQLSCSTRTHENLRVIHKLAAGSRSMSNLVRSKWFGFLVFFSFLFLLFVWVFFWKFMMNLVVRCSSGVQYNLNNITIFKVNPVDFMKLVNRSVGWMLGCAIGKPMSHRA